MCTFEWRLRHIFARRTVLIHRRRRTLQLWVSDAYYVLQPPPKLPQENVNSDCQFPASFLPHMKYFQIFKYVNKHLWHLPVLTRWRQQNGSDATRKYGVGSAVPFAYGQGKCGCFLRRLGLLKDPSENKGPTVSRMQSLNWDTAGFWYRRAFI